MINKIDIGLLFKRFCYIIVGVFSLLFFCGNFFMSSTLGTQLDTYLGMEKTIFIKDNIFLNVISMLIIFVVIFALYVLCEHIKVEDNIFKDKFTIILFLICSVITFFVSIIWALSLEAHPFADGNICSEIAVHLINGTFADNEYLNYVKDYPHQIGYITYLRLIYFVFGINNYTMVRVFNVLAIVGSWAGLVFISETTFKKRDTTRLTIVFLTLFLPLPLYSASIYNQVPSMFLAVYGLFFAIKFSQKNCCLYGVLSMICLTLGGLIRQHVQILVIAITIYFMIKFITKIDFKSAIFVFLVVLFSFTSSNVAVKLFEINTSVDMGNAKISLSNYLYMGISESGERGPGWYSGHRSDLFSQGFSEQEVEEILKDESIILIKEYITNPVKGISFFSRKLASMWCESTFQCIDNVRFSYLEDGGRLTEIENKTFIKNILTNKYDSQIQYYFGGVQSIIYLFLCIYVLKNIKNPDDNEFLLLLFFLGGIAFHFFWEAKSSYVILYFVFIIPLSAKGFTQSMQYFVEKPKAKLLVR